MGKVKASKVSQLKPKKKCCRKKTRCIKCPVVIMRMKKLENEGRIQEGTESGSQEGSCGVSALNSASNSGIQARSLSTRSIDNSSSASTHVN